MYAYPTDNLELNLASDVERVRAGDERALTRVIEGTSALVTSIALAIVKDVDRAEDVAQTVYITLWQKLDSLNNPASFLPWLRQVTRNTAMNSLRRDRVGQRIGGDEADRLLADFADVSVQPDMVVSRAQQSAILGDFIDRLPESDREAIVLFYREGESSQKVAQMLGISDVAVRKKLSRARERLKDRLLKHAGELLLSTAPTAALVGSILSSLAAPVPVAAAVATSSISNTASSSITKILMTLGGAAIGGLLAVVAIVAGSKWQRKDIDDPHTQAALVQLRNVNVVLVVIFSICFVLSYELTSGWVAPVLSYTLFACVLTFSVIRGNSIVTEYRQRRGVSSESALRRFIRCYLGLVIGLLTGYAGLVFGMLNSGRLVM